MRVFESRGRPARTTCSRVLSTTGIQLSDPPAQWELEVLRAIGLAPAQLNALRAIEGGQVRGFISRTDPHFAAVRELIRHAAWIDGDMRQAVDKGCEVRGLTCEGREKLRAAERALAARQGGRDSATIAGFLCSGRRGLGETLGGAGRLSSRCVAAAFVCIRIGAVAAIVSASIQSPVFPALLCAHGELLSDSTAGSDCILFAYQQLGIEANERWHAHELHGKERRSGGDDELLTSLAAEW